MITRTARSLLKLNNKIVGFSFCIGKAHLDPYKHTTMSHSPHNMFVDLYDFGQYPQIIAPASIAARTYQPHVVSIAVEVLNSKYGTNLTVEDFNSKLSRPWSRFIKKDLKSDDSLQVVLNGILNRLSVSLFVKESRWTWIRQQKQRLNNSYIYFQKNEPQTVGDFLDGYNGLIEELVLSSSFGYSPYISQAATPLEKHYVQQMLDSQHQGVEQLNNAQGETNNFINKAMAFIHRI